MATSSRSGAKWTRVTLVNQAHTGRSLGLFFRRRGKVTLVPQIHFKRITGVIFPPPRKSNPCIPSRFKRITGVIFPPPRKSNPCIPSRFKRITGVIFPPPRESNPCIPSRLWRSLRLLFRRPGKVTLVTLARVVDRKLGLPWYATTRFGSFPGGARKEKFRRRAPWSAQIKPPTRAGAPKRAIQEDRVHEQCTFLFIPSISSSSTVPSIKPSFTFAAKGAIQRSLWEPTIAISA
jgi:hypothetical protein